MEKSIMYDGISWAAEFIRSSFKSENDFLNHCKENLHWFENQPNRIQKLKEVFALCVGKPKPDVVIPDKEEE